MYKLLGKVVRKLINANPRLKELRHGDFADFRSKLFIN